MDRVFVGSSFDILVTADKLSGKNFKFCIKFQIIVDFNLEIEIAFSFFIDTEAAQSKHQQFLLFSI